MNHNFKNLVGQKFNRLLVIQLLPTRDNQGRVNYLCLCKCGNTTTVRGSLLKNDHTKSCGCLDREKSSQRFKDKNPGLKLTTGEAAFRQVLRTYKRDAKARGYSFELTIDEARDLMLSNCFYCGLEPQIKSGLESKFNGSFLRNGIDRKDNSKGYTLENCVSCCFICNKAKWTQSTEEFKTWLTRTYNHLSIIPKVSPSLAKWIVNQ
jgi:hypothetical protein